MCAALWKLTADFVHVNADGIRRVFANDARGLPVRRREVHTVHARLRRERDELRVRLADFATAQIELLLGEHGDGAAFGSFVCERRDRRGVSEALRRFEHRVEPGFAIGIKDPHEVKPHRLGDHRECGDVEGELKPARGLHSNSLSNSLESLRPNHGHEQVDEQQQGDEADNDGFHSASRVFRRSGRKDR